MARIAADYDDGLYRLFPLQATENIGDARFEAALEVDIAPAHRERQRRFYQQLLRRADALDERTLTPDERLTRALLQYESRERLAQLQFPQHWLPMNHQDMPPTRLAQYASGQAAQPMKTVANYEHFLARLHKLPAWTDQAIVNMREGMAHGVTQPRPLMERVLTQLADLRSADVAQSPFAAATRSFPAGISAADQARLRAAYARALRERVAPALNRLHDFVQQVYLPACRSTAGLGALPQGDAWYRTLARFSTTTQTPVEDIHQQGLAEVARIRGEMEQVKARFGYDGDLNSFLASLSGRAELRPFRSEAEVIEGYNALNQRIVQALPRLFDRTPPVPLEIRPVDPLMRDTASDSYVAAALDGSRPGRFIVVVQDPAQYRSTGMVSLFLHEGLPGHHFQIATQQALEVPRFRRALWYDAYGEGWALYAEGLGRDLGVYDDPNAYLGRLLMELHRAIRLVVDTGLHAKGWTREQTIRYIMDTEGADEPRARRATERYMGWPGQALAYKVGELRIIAARERAKAMLGERFDIRRFHTEVLRDGPMPLDMLDAKLDRWMKAEAAR